MVGGSFLIAQCMCGHFVCGHFVVNSVFHIRSSNGSEQWSMKINISVNGKQICGCVCLCVTHVRRSISVGLYYNPRQWGYLFLRNWSVNSFVIGLLPVGALRVAVKYARYDKQFFVVGLQWQSINLKYLIGKAVSSAMSVGCLSVHLVCNNQWQSSYVLFRKIISRRCQCLCTIINGMNINGTVGNTSEKRYCHWVNYDNQRQ